MTASPTILLRADASTAIGFGHLSRCLTLAQALRDQSARCMLVVSQDSSAALAGLGDELERRVLDVEPGSSEDAQATAQLAADEHAVLVVADGYALRDPWLQQVRARGVRCAYIDDYASGRYDCDAVLNHNVFAEGAVLDAPADCVCLLGPAYALVKPSFRVARLARSAPPGDAPPQRLVVTLGGSDPTGTTLSLLRWLGELAADTLAAMHVRVVLGPAFTELAAARELSARARHHRLELVEGVSDLAPVFAWADLIVTAAGVTCLEVACIGVPMLVVCLAENQQRTADGVVQRGMGWSLGDHASLSAEHVLAELARLSTHPEARRAMVATQRAIVDGDGPERAAAALLIAFAAPTQG